MSTKLSRCQAVQIISAVLVSCLGSTVAAQWQREPAQPDAARESAAATSGKAVPREQWHRSASRTRWRGEPRSRRWSQRPPCSRTLSAERPSPTSTTATVDPSPTDCRPWRSTFTSISPWSRSSTTRATRDAPASWCSPLLAAAWCVSAQESSNSTGSSPTTWSRDHPRDPAHAGAGREPAILEGITARVLARCGRK